MAKSYSEKLRDPRWQKKRLDIMDRDGFQCRACHAKDKTLNVHHRVYRKGKEPWEYDDEMLVTFCEDCHKTVEDSIRMVAERCAFDEDLVKTMEYLLEPKRIGLLGVLSDWIYRKKQFSEDPSVSNHNDLESSALRMVGYIVHSTEDEE